MPKQLSSVGPAKSDVSGILATRIESLESALRTVAALNSEWCESLRAICSGTLAMIDGTSASTLDIARLVMHVRDELHDMDNTISAECEAVGCGPVSRRLEAVQAQVDRASAGARLA